MSAKDISRDPVEEIAPGTRPAIAPDGAKTEEEIERDQSVSDDDAARIDPNSDIPRPVQPDLA